MTDQTMATYMVTFGQRYRQEAHPVLWRHGALVPDGWVEVIAEDEGDAGRLLTKCLGQAWAFVYSSDAFDGGLYPAGCLATLRGDSSGASVLTHQPRPRIEPEVTG